MGFVDIHYADGEIFEINLDTPGHGIPIPEIRDGIKKVVINHAKYPAEVSGHHTYFFENEVLVMFGGQKYINFHIGGIRSDGSCHGYLFDKENIGLGVFNLSNKNPATLALLLKTGAKEGP